MGRTSSFAQPKSRTSKKPKNENIPCIACGETKKYNQFYQSYNPVHKGTGRLPYCKDCLKNMCLDNKGNINVLNMKKMLELIDRPFIYEVFKSSMEDKSDTLGCYFKNLALPQFKNLYWSDSLFEVAQPVNKKPDVVDETINITELEEKYGYGFQPEEYKNFERKYNKLHRGYKEKTDLHTERLLTYIIHKVKGEMAAASGNVSEAEKWEKLAQTDATAAKLNISQLSKSDITGGIDLIPQLVEAVEQHASLIPLLPKLLEQPYDDADLIIWANINYNRHVEDKPFIPYRDVWNFYDKMLEEYYKQKGYDEEKVKIEKTKRNNVFRDLGEVYIEPLYENPDEFIEESGESDEFS